MIISIQLLVLIVGLIMYVLGKDAKIQEIGRIMFAFALLAILLGAEQIVKIFTNHA